MSSTQHCQITVDMLKTYQKPDKTSPLVRTKNRYVRGMPLTFTTVPGHNQWGFYSTGEKFYFWLGEVRITQAVLNSQSENE